MKFRGSKYRNRKITFNGEVFDSKRELARFCDLVAMQDAGQIAELSRQVKYILIPTQREPDRVGTRGGKIRGKVIEKEVSYKADFVYRDLTTGELVVEDTKGYKGGQAYAVFVIKRKLMLERYNIRVREV